MSRPLLSIAVALAFGCLTGEAAGKTAIGVLLALALLLLWLAVRAGGERAGATAVAAAAVAMGAAAAGLESLAHETTPLRRWVEARGEDAAPVLLEGWARGDSQARPDRLRLTLDV